MAKQVVSIRLESELVEKMDSRGKRGDVIAAALESFLLGREQASLGVDPAPPVTPAPASGADFATSHDDFNVTVVDPDAARVMVDARAKQIGGPMWRARVQAIQELRAEGAIE